MTPEEQKEHVQLLEQVKEAQTALATANEKIKQLDEDIGKLKEINQELFVKATTSIKDEAPQIETDSQISEFTTDDLIKILKGE